MAFTIEIVFESLVQLQKEYTAHLYNGGAFAPGPHDVAPNERGTIALVHPVSGEHLLLPAKAVWVKPAGIGLAVVNFNANIRAALTSFVQDEAEPEPIPADTPPATDHTTATPEMDRAGSNPMVALKGLSAAEMRKKAHTATLSERKALERMYGRNVWDSLLRNPQITIPEVAQMAQKGTMPRPLIELIAGNNTWLSSPLVRRALLSNPKLGSDMMTRVLRMTPQNELKLIPRQTAYSQMVRMAAKKLIK